MMQDSMLACPRSLVWMLPLLLSLLCTNALEANDFVWEGACGSGEWYATCFGDLCESNPDRYWIYNNWGRVSCGGPPALPGVLDNVLLPDPGVVLYNTVSLAQLTIGVGGGLTVSGQPAVLMPHGDLTNDGQVVIEDGATLALEGSALNGGTIGLYAGAHLRFDSDGLAHGPGDVCLETGDVSTNAGVRFTNSYGHTFHGRGTLNVAMDNLGSIVADRAGETLTINPRGLGVANYGGRVEAQSGCYLTINNASLFNEAGLIVVDGTLSVNDGALRLNPGFLTGSGVVAGDVVNVSGTVAPGAASTAVLSISGSYTQAAEGQLEIQLGGTDPGTGYDRLAVGGDAELHSLLRVTTTNGFNPVPGQQFVIVTAATVTGSYGQTFPSGENVNFAYKTVYSQHDVTLVISTPRPGDLNCDDQINFRDINPFVLYLASVSGWRQEYPACPPQNGDINADGTYPSFGDINPFVALLTGG